MDANQFDFELPEELIAQAPARPRDASRLMVVGDPVQHLLFRDIAGILREGDVVVLNDTRVIPARLRGEKDTGGRLEFLLVRRDGDVWEAMVRGRPRDGATGRIADMRFRLEAAGGGRWFVHTDPVLDERALESFGEPPTPPYIRGRASGDDYQTVYARVPGSIAAPTAGLHFTETLMRDLEGNGVRFVRITLHIGPGTFTPVRSERVEDHVMEAERYTIDPGVMDAIEGADRLVCVGTSTVRTLEAALRTGRTSGWADVFIFPGMRLRTRMDMFLTNLHLPRSPPLLMVAAFAGWDRVRSAYAEAISAGYRFYSFGDAMLLYPEA
ncbi:MAG: tRNA preQ1(34) S-adenosylmethionine ribosyltransferase-isomerase QueA [Thermoplasmata archaeon]|nr:tRNA preQ1(34) S-adenosylmethionine ribosyltransferase-isomerase QueA [Thermoplasmata archaeon]